MKKYNLLSIILLAILVVSCGPSEKDKLSYFSFNTSAFKEQYQPNESISLEILNTKNKKVDSIIYYVNDAKIATKKGLEKATLELKNKKLGYQNLKALVYFEGENVETTARVELVSDIEPKLLKYQIINTFPHDTLAFTEGLEFMRDTLFESTGSPEGRKAYFRKYDYKTGKVYKQVDLDEQYFGEGITMLNNKIFQLTWQSSVGFIYDLNTLKNIKIFTFDKQVEGWGLTNDGKYLYQSDGTEKIWKMDSENLKMIDYINVYTSNSKIKRINELEWINGKIYCNIWTTDAIAIVNPTTGSVEAVLNLTDLRKQLKFPKSEVLNGIAYNKKTGTIFVTGKNWDKMFEIKVSE